MLKPGGAFEVCFFFDVLFLLVFFFSFIAYDCILVWLIMVLSCFVSWNLDSIDICFYSGEFWLSASLVLVLVSLYSSQRLHDHRTALVTHAPNTLTLNF